MALNRGIASTMKTSEAYIENKVKEYAKSKGWITYKWSSPAQRGVPDRLFFRGGTVLAVEFKAPGKKPTPLQNFHIAKLSTAGILVHVIDNAAQGKALIDENS